jgi:hypothetical protein
LKTGLTKKECVQIEKTLRGRTKVKEFFELGRKKEKKL